jgi:hypothetical protein
MRASDAPGAAALLRSLLRAGPFAPPALAHLLRTLLECALLRPAADAAPSGRARDANSDALAMYAHVAASLLRSSTAAGASPYAFRRALVDALEDAGVRLLAAASPAFGGALPAAPPCGDAPTAHAAAAAAGAMRALLRALCRHDTGVLSAEDVSDLADGCPGSRHSAGLVDSELAARKAAFFRSAVPTELLDAPPTAQPLACVRGSEDAAWAAARVAAAAQRAVPPSHAQLQAHAPMLRRFESALYGEGATTAAPPALSAAAAAVPVTAGGAHDRDALRSALLAAAAAGVPRAELDLLRAFAEAAPTRFERFGPAQHAPHRHAYS